MITWGITVLEIVALVSPALAGPVHCTSWEDRELKRLVSTCTDGARAITRYDEEVKRWHTEMIRPPKDDNAPAGWPVPGQPPR